MGNSDKAKQSKNSKAAKVSEEVESSQKQENKFNWHRLFKYLTFIVTCLIILIYRDVERYYQYSEKHGSPYHPSSEYKWSVLVAGCIFIFRYGLYYLIKSRVEGWIDHRYTGQARVDHVRRMVKYIADMLYYSAAWGFGYYIFWKGGYVPFCLGGNRECGDAMAGYPFLPTLPMLKEFYLVQLGNHYFALLDQLLFKRLDKNYWEMMLHHVMTCGLMMLSYHTNILTPGVLCLLLHDPGDVTLCLARFYADLKCKKTFFVVIFYFFNLFVWVYFRLYCIPGCFLYPAFKEFINLEAEIFSIIKLTMGLQITMVGILYLMHIYWVVLILERAVLMIWKKKLHTT